LWPRSNYCEPVVGNPGYHIETLFALRAFFKNISGFDPGHAQSTRHKRREHKNDDTRKAAGSIRRRGRATGDLPVEVLCEDRSGTYQLPFVCRFVDGTWRNDESGSKVEATVVGWRLQRP